MGGAGRVDGVGEGSVGGVGDDKGRRGEWDRGKQDGWGRRGVWAVTPGRSGDSGGGYVLQ